MYPWIPQETIPVPPEISQIKIPIELIYYDSNGFKLGLVTYMNIIKKQRIYTKIGPLILTTFQFEGKHPCLPPCAKSIIRKVSLDQPKPQVRTKEQLLYYLQTTVFQVRPGNPI